MSTDLITEHLDLWTSAVTYNNGKGRGNNGEPELTGIQKLRELILELAVRGKLVPQDPVDEPAYKLLERIEEEKARLYKKGKIKKPKKLPEIKEEEKPFEVPSGWQWARMGEVQSFFNGLAFKSREFVDEGVGVVRIGDVSWYGKIIPKGMKRLPSEKAEEIEEKFWVRPGDLVITMTGDVKVGFNRTDESFLLNQRVGKVVPHFLCSNYVFRFLQTVAKEKIENAFGGVIPNVSTKEINNTPISLPPLSEQYRIVEKVDELMALCDRLEQQTSDQLSAHETLVDTLLDTLTNSQDAAELADNWARLAEHFDTLFTTEHSIDRLEQTILQLAVMGRLVPQDPNEESAANLLERIAAEKWELYREGKAKRPKEVTKLTEEEKPFSLPKGWVWGRVWDVATLITSGSRDWAKYYSEKGAIFLTMGNLSKSDYRLRMENIRYVSPPENSEGHRTKLEPGDLVVSITGEVGNLGLIPEGFGEAYINQHSALVRLSSLLQNRYFAEFMRSPWAKFQFDAPQRGVKNSFRLSDIGEMSIPLPPVNEQHRIVEKVDELMVLCDRLRWRIAEVGEIQQQLAESVVKQAVV